MPHKGICALRHAQPIKIAVHPGLAKRQAIKEEKTGAVGLFEPPPPELPAGELYEHQSPTRPFGDTLCAECTPD